MPDSTIHRNALPLPSMLLEYRLESVLGAGAFGITYLGWDTHLEKHVAIKEYLPTELAVRALDGSVVPINTEHDYNYQWGRDRFLLEARTLARFSHPNIVRINRYFEANGTAYVVMDYEKGEALSQSLKAGPRPDEARLRALLMPLLDGLHAVHEAGFLHRDIKPANVFIRENGVPVLLDFGAARQAVGGATRSLTSVLTPGYAPLEQYSSDGNQGPWSDIYALGGVLYRALVNENPPDAVSRMRSDVVPEKLGAARADASDTLLKATAWALALDEKQRPQSVREWQRVLRGELPVPYRPPVGRAAATALSQGSTLPSPAAANPQRAATRRAAPPRPEPPAGPGWRWGLALVLILAISAAGWWSKQREAERRAAEAAAQAEARRQAEQRRDAARKLAPREAQAQPEPVRERPPREREERFAPPDAEKPRLWAEADFRSADSNADGYLSPEEVRNRFPMLAKEYARVDADSDGRISKEEFMRFRQRQMLEKPQK